MKKFRVKVGEKIFEVEVEEIKPEAPAMMPSTTAVSKVTTVGREVSPPTPPTEAPPHAKEGEVGMVRAPIPGTIVSIKCAEGDYVKKGDPLLVLESMKMENVIYSPASGKVKRIAVSEGASVKYGDLLVEIE